jgi:hypothetical protein
MRPVTFQSLYLLLLSGCKWLANSNNKKQCSRFHFSWSRRGSILPTNQNTSQLIISKTLCITTYFFDIFGCNWWFLLAIMEEIGLKVAPQQKVDFVEKMRFDIFAA